ncbi:hypothetical protein VTH82DRAFT_7750 [Thermothelomyces myriococcoides]
MPSMSTSRPANAGSFDSGNGGRTAAVLEFICLFTYDLRKKQKRWEDGRLRYHTFNKRVMVYDDRGNFVGDLHWTREEEFGEGEEVQLERGTAIIQVMDCVGRKEQDLSELLDKRAKEKEQRQARLLGRPSLAGPSATTPVAGPRAEEHFQTRHRPLNHLLGTPTGHYGRAVVPTESPFELRQKANGSLNDNSDSRPLKRIKRDITPPSKKGYAQNLFGATLSLSAVPLSSAPLRRSASSISHQQNTSTPQQQPREDIRPGASDETRHREHASNVQSQSTTARVNLSSPNGAAAVPFVRTGEEAGGREDRSTLQSTSKTLGCSYGEKAIRKPQSEGVVESAEGIDQSTASSGKSGPLAVAARRPEDQSRVEGKDMARHMTEPSKEVLQGKLSTTTQAKEFDPPLPQPSPRKDSRRGKKVGSQADPLRAQQETAASTKAIERQVQPTYASQSDTDIEAEASDSAELPRSFGDRRRMRSRAKGSLRARDVLHDSDDEGTSSEAQTEIPAPRPSHRTRKTESLDDQGLVHPRKKARKVDSEDGAEAFPRAQAKPRLAKLGRRSVKSREIFGLVPSSSPPAILMNAAGANVAADGQGSISPVSDQSQPFRSESATIFHEEAPPAVQPSYSDQHSRANRRLDEMIQKDQITATAVLQSDQMMRRSIARSAPSDYVRRSGDKDMVTRTSSPPGPRDINVPRKAVAQAATSRREGDTAERRSAAPATDGEMVEPRLNSEQTRFSEPSRAAVNNIADIGSESGVTKLNAVSRTEGSSRPKIANPATRGRKAALESDAAGRAPRPILPPDPAPAWGSLVRPEPAAPRESGRPKRQMKFPGFTSARGGGPWSREAHDLLESARPN